MPACCRLVVDLLATRPTIPQQIATSRYNGIWETTRHNRHNGLLPAPTCYRLVMDFSFMLRTCCGFATGKLV